MANVVVGPSICSSRPYKYSLPAPMMMQSGETSMPRVRRRYDAMARRSSGRPLNGIDRSRLSLGSESASRM